MNSEKTPIREGIYNASNIETSPQQGVGPRIGELLSLQYLRSELGIEGFSKSVSEVFPADPRPHSASIEDTRNHQAYTHNEAAFRYRLRHSKEFVSFLSELHAHATQKISFGHGTLGYLAAICAAGHVLPIYESRKAESKIDIQSVPAQLMQIGGFFNGLSYVSQIMLALHVNPEYKLNSRDLTKFILKSNMLIGPETVCPIPEAFLRKLIDMSLTPGDVDSKIHTPAPDTDYQRVIDLGQSHIQFRIASAIPWSSKPTHVSWENWVKPDFLDASVEQSLLSLERTVYDVLGFKSNNTTTNFTSDDIINMRRGKTVFRDDQLELLHEVFPSNAFYDESFLKH